ncbi:MAG: alkaline phosphatase family protein [Gemmatimonadota bacterium]|nr:alkaline phosphatase family protein [Gemmatimonadota bacterium]
MRFALVAFVSCALSTAAPSQQLPPANSELPTLVVFITVDQLTPDYFDRYGAQFTGGFARLLRAGAVFTNAFQDHGVTETAPGHASTLSGRFPRHTGIIRNDAGVEDDQSPVLYEKDWGASPFRFRGGTLIDWLRTKDPRSRALSVSRKDRGAILPLGRAHQLALFYSYTGIFTTSTYYGDTLPSWVQQYNARHIPQSYAGKSWDLLLPASAYSEPDSVPFESGGRDFVFPHPGPPDAATAAKILAAYPFMDEVTAQVALAGLRAEKLGAGPATDVLAVSFSTTDAVGHRFGPDSREIHDQILRLDRTLGAFLDTLYQLRDSTKVVVALTADHGITSLPEVYSQRERKTAIRVNVSAVMTAMRTALVARGLDRFVVQFSDGMFMLDRWAVERAKLNADSVVDVFVKGARATPGVMRVDLAKDLVRDTSTTIARRWYHSVPDDSPVQAVVTLEPHNVWSGPAETVAEHGSPWDSDAHVPIIFYGAPFKPGRYAAFSRVVDMAPTLAYVTGTLPTEPLDGHILIEGLRVPPVKR